MNRGHSANANLSAHQQRVAIFPNSSTVSVRNSLGFGKLDQAAEIQSTALSHDQKSAGRANHTTRIPFNTRAAVLDLGLGWGGP